MTIENPHSQNTPSSTSTAQELAKRFGPFTLAIEGNIATFVGTIPESAFQVGSKTEAREILAMGIKTGFFDRNNYDQFLRDINSSTLPE